MANKEVLQEVQKRVDDTYRSLGQIVLDLTNKYTKDIDSIIQKVSNDVETRTNKELQTDVLKLSCLAYSLGDVMEHANLKSECANALLKEENAQQYIASEGSVENKKNNALLATTNEQAVNMMYETVASLLKTKLNETHRVVDSIKNILILRSAEAKMQNVSNNIEEEV